MMRTYECIMKKIGNCPKGINKKYFFLFRVKEDDTMQSLNEEHENECVQLNCKLYSHTDSGKREKETAECGILCNNFTMECN